MLKLNSFEYGLEAFEILPEVKPANTRKGSNGTNPKNWLLEALKGVQAHNPGRNKTAAKICGYFLDKLDSMDVLTILLAWNEHNQPPLPREDIIKIFNSVSRYKQTNDEPKRIRVSFKSAEKEGARVSVPGR